MIYLNFTTPDDKNKYNFVFDTYVLEKKLASDSDVVEKCQYKLKYDYRYYISDVQINEVLGRPVRKYKHEDQPIWTPSKNIDKVQRVVDALCIERISCVAANLPNFTFLDGSFREYPDYSASEPITAMLFEIHNKNLKHLMDAIIAEAAIYNKCYLVSTDIRAIGIVNKYFPDNAFHYDEFIDRFLT